MPKTIRLKVMEGTFSKFSTSNYPDLENLPSINGTTLIGNYDEIDPTVPGWAKEEIKPSYTSEEIGAIDEDNEMSMSDIVNLWNSVFND